MEGAAAVTAEIYWMLVVFGEEGRKILMERVS
jgi:hypothetical protein